MTSVAKMIADFKARSGGGKFTKISRGDVAKGLEERVRNPWKIDQSEGSLCGPAALMFSVADRRLMKLYVKYVIDLYDDGKALLGDSPGIWVTPSRDCKNFKPGSKIPPVDWVALAALIDSENDFFSYQDTSDKVSGITSASQLSNWLDKCGFNNRKDTTTWVDAEERANLEEASALHNQGHTICILCKKATIDGVKGGFFTTPSHWVVMTKPATFSGGNVSLQVFSWGDLKDVNWPEDTFFSTYFGYLSAKP